MKEYKISYSELDILIKYDNTEDLIYKFEDIINCLINYGYGAFSDDGTDGMLQTLKENCFYKEDYTITNEKDKETNVLGDFKL